MRLPAARSFLLPVLCTAGVLTYLVLASGGFSSVLTYSAQCAHKVTSVGILEGQLAYPRPLGSGLEFDMQVRNGAQFSNWGYGVPLLQAPFHALARLFSRAPYFPDRAIYFFYLSLTAILLLFAFSRLFQERFGCDRNRAFLFSTTFTGFLFTYALLPITSFHFMVYEETVAYAVLLQLILLGLYVLQVLSPRRSYPELAGSLAAMGPLIRGSGIVAFSVWSSCFYLIDRDRKKLARFLLGALPLLWFGAYSNYRKTGSIFSIGLQNTISGSLAIGPQLRFGALGAKSLTGAMEVFRQFFVTLFWGYRPLPSRLVWLNYGIERGLPFPVPYVSRGFLVALILIFALRLRRGTASFASAAPYLGILTLLAAYAFASANFNYRYAGDFWPLIFLVLVQFLLLPSPAPRFRKIAALALALLPLLFFRKALADVFPNLKTLELRTRLAQAVPIDTELGTFPISTPLGACWTGDREESLRLNRRTWPNRLSCDPTTGLVSRRWMGWNPGCDVQDMTSFFVGLPEAGIVPSYRLVLDVDRRLPAPPRVYINGAYYEAGWDGHSYSVRFALEEKKLYSRLLLVSVLWSDAYPPLPLRLFGAAIL